MQQYAGIEGLKSLERVDGDEKSGLRGNCCRLLGCRNEKNRIATV